MWVVSNSCNWDWHGVKTAITVGEVDNRISVLPTTVDTITSPPGPIHLQSTRGSLNQTSYIAPDRHQVCFEGCYSFGVSRLLQYSHDVRATCTATQRIWSHRFRAVVSSTLPRSERFLPPLDFLVLLPTPYRIPNAGCFHLSDLTAIHIGGRCAHCTQLYL